MRSRPRCSATSTGSCSLPTTTRRRDIPTVPDTTPFLFLDCISTGSNPVVTEVIADEAQGSFDATSHLISAGHTHVGYVGVDDDRYIARHLREKASAMLCGNTSGRGNAADHQRGGSLHFCGRSGSRFALLPPGGRTTHGAVLLLGSHRVRSRTGGPTARLSLPEDLSIVGFDNVEYTSEFFTPRLTTVELPHQRMSSEAVRQLVHLIENPRCEPHRLKVPCPLIHRDSVNPHHS
ncbi:substrate-binding domain-containing protein [Brachybacterium sacelli]|uniref:substrate-binding domain-containing protein n=1 Tax=Brachybacterium sacelli TaxID=173364 RepID=UPI00360D82A5